MLGILKSEKPEAAVRRLLEAEIDLDAKRQSLLEDVASARARLGKDYLQGQLTGHVDASRSVAMASSLQTQLSGVETAIIEARTARLEAIPRVWQAEARKLRKQAKAKCSEADQRQKKTDKLLAELKDFECCDYVARPADLPPRIGGPLPGFGGSTDMTFIPTPRTELLRLEARELDQQADGLEARKPVDSGRATGSTAAELVQEATADHMTMCPPIAQIRQWAQRCRVEFDKHQRNLQEVQPDYGAAIRFDLLWQRSAIDEKASRWELVRTAQETAA